MSSQKRKEEQMDAEKREEISCGGTSAKKTPEAQIGDTLTSTDLDTINGRPRRGRIDGSDEPQVKRGRRGLSEAPAPSSLPTTTPEDTMSEAVSTIDGQIETAPALAFQEPSTLPDDEGVNGYGGQQGQQGDEHQRRVGEIEQAADAPEPALLINVAEPNEDIAPPQEAPRKVIDVITLSDDDDDEVLKRCRYHPIKLEIETTPWKGLNLTRAIGQAGGGSGGVSVANIMEKANQDAPALPNNVAEPKDEPPQEKAPRRVIDVITLSDDEDEIPHRTNSNEVTLEDIIAIKGPDALKTEESPPSSDIIYIRRYVPLPRTYVLVRYCAGNYHRYYYNDSQDYIHVPGFPNPNTWIDVFEKSWTLIEDLEQGPRIGKAYKIFCKNQRLFYGHCINEYVREITDKNDDLDSELSEFYWLFNSLSRREHESRFTYYRYSNINALYKFYHYIDYNNNFTMFRAGNESETRRLHLQLMNRFWRGESSRRTRSLHDGYIFLSDVMECTYDCRYLTNMRPAIDALPADFREFLKDSDIYTTIIRVFEKINSSSDPVFEQLDMLKITEYTLPLGELAQLLLLNIGNSIFFFNGEWSILPGQSEQVFKRIPFGPNGTEIPDISELEEAENASEQ